MKTSILTLVTLFAALSGCTTKNNSMSTTRGESPDARDSIASQKSQAAGESRTTGEPRNDSDRNYSSGNGKGAPALGGPGDRENASVSAARGSAHDGVTDSTHTNALKRPDAESAHAKRSQPAKGH